MLLRINLLFETESPLLSYENKGARKRVHLTRKTES